MDKGHALARLKAYNKAITALNIVAYEFDDGSKQVTREDAVESEFLCKKITRERDRHIKKYLS